jgi:hypothetical protein
MLRLRRGSEAPVQQRPVMMAQSQEVVPKLRASGWDESPHYAADYSIAFDALLPMIRQTRDEISPATRGSSSRKISLRTEARSCR